MRRRESRCSLPPPIERESIALIEDLNHKVNQPPYNILLVFSVLMSIKKNRYGGKTD